MIGRVALVGAGPGDPGLLTMRAHELLRQATVLAHDELVPEAILALAPPTAERLRVGRRHGQGTVSYRCHPAVLERALAGQDVVRLKTGDPYIFGRGGEEVAELTAAGIAVEVVPGVTAALGAAASTGIPLTLRGVAAEVTLVSGHDGECGAGVDWDCLGASRGTLVLYMAGHTLASCAARLIAGGRSPATPAALINGATTPEQRVVVATLADLADLAGPPAAAPTLIIIGDVVGHRIAP